MSGDSDPHGLPLEAQVLAFGLAASGLESRRLDVPQRLRISMKDGSVVADASLEAMRHRYPNHDVDLGRCNPSDYYCASLRVEVISDSENEFVVRAWAVDLAIGTWSEYCLHFDGSEWFAEKGTLAGGVIG